MGGISEYIYSKYYYGNGVCVSEPFSSALGNVVKGISIKPGTIFFIFTPLLFLIVFFLEYIMNLIPYLAFLGGVLTGINFLKIFLK